MITQSTTTDGVGADHGIDEACMAHRAISIPAPLRDAPLRGPRYRPPTVYRHGGDNDAGMTTAEYAIGTLAAAAFAAVLYAVVSSDAVVGALTGLVERALTVSF